jgi:TonB-linked SusC/RagA family outer membrane protein
MYNFYTNGALQRRRIVKFLIMMKLLTLLLIIPLLQVSATVHAQRINLDKRNAPLSEIFDEISRQTDYDFVYSKKQLHGAKPVTIYASNASITQVLEQCFTRQPFGYQIANKSVTIRTKNAPVTIRPGLSDSITVKGMVVDQDSQPLNGAIIRVMGTGKITRTNSTGQFTLARLDENALLEISFTGYHSVQIEANKDLTNIVLSVFSEKLQEVEIVATGYQTISKERSTGSFVKIDSALFNREVSTSVLSRLEGITNGLYVDNRVGGQTLNIRGISTLNDGMRGALVVVDNFPYQGSLENINPNDVEHITVLKDAAAASIWGARAANGVIVITLKKGRYNRPLNVVSNANLTVVEKPDLYYLPQISSSDFIDVEQLLFSKNHYAYDLSPFNESKPAISPVLNILDQREKGILSASQATATIDKLRNADYRKDLKRYFYQKAINQQYNLSFDGGGKTNHYLISTGFDQNKNSLIGNSYSRFTFRAVTNLRPIKNLEISSSVALTQSNTTSNGLEAITTGAGKSTLYPYAQLADPSGNALRIAKNYNLNFTDTAGTGKLLDWNYKPLDELKTADNSRMIQDINFGTNLNYRLLENLDAEILYKYERQSAAGRRYNNQESYFTRNLINEFSQLSGNQIKRAVPLGGILDREYASLSSHNLRGQLNYHQLIGGKHELNALAGAETTQAHSTSNSDRTYGYSDDILSFANVDLVSQHPTFDNLYTAHRGFIPGNTAIRDGLNRLVSAYSNLAYTFDRRYTFSASARRDAANIFGVNANQKWKPLWSVGGSWTLSNEKFYHLNWLSYLKLRATYGYGGNVNADVITRPVILYVGSPASYTNLPYALITSPPNPDAKWEQLRTINFGLDFAIEHNKISGSFEYFSKKTDDLFSPAPIDATTGFTATYRNIAQTKGKGFEITIHSKNIDGQFKWSTTASVAYVKDMVTKYYNPPQLSSAYVSNTVLISPIEKYPLYPVFSYKFSGLDPQTGDPRGFYDGQVSKEYPKLINDSLKNLNFHGSAIPLYIGNVINTFSWRNFSLSFNITYKLNYFFHRSTIKYNGLFNNWAGHSDYAKRWQKPGDELKTNIPSLSYPADNSRDVFFAGSRETVEKGNHIRLNDLRLSYSFSNAESVAKGLKNLQCFIYANNLGILWRANNSGIDPDLAQSALPLQKSLSVGVKTAF